jgi:hypothetical protein
MTWSLPYHQGHLTNTELGTDTRDHSLGDPLFSMRWDLIHKPAPSGQLALDLTYKGPAGKESPGTFIGGPLNMSAFVFTTGTPDLTTSILGKKQMGPLAVQGRLGYMHRFPAVVQYLVELDQLQFLGRIKPGDVAEGDLGLEFQLGPLVLSAAGNADYRQVTKIGTTAKGFNSDRNLDPVVGSDGVALDADLGLALQVSRGIDLKGHLLLPLAGEDLQFFPIEDIHPTYGRTFGASIELRY